MRILYLGALLMIGCGDSSPEPNAYDDAARLVGASVATPDGGAMMGAVGDSIVLAFGGMPAGFTEQSASLRGMHGDLEHQYIMVQCRDKDGALIKPCTQLTDTATLVSSWAGMVETSDLAVHQTRQGMWTLDNLQTWMPTIHGSSTLTIHGVVDGRSYELTGSGTETLAIPEYMMGGAMHLDVVLARNGVDTPISVDVTFDDLLTSASLTLDEYTYRIDLATGDVTP